MFCILCYKLYRHGGKDKSYAKLSSQHQVKAMAITPFHSLSVWYTTPHFICALYELPRQQCNINTKQYRGGLLPCFKLHPILFFMNKICLNQSNTCALDYFTVNTKQYRGGLLPCFKPHPILFFMNKIYLNQSNTCALAYFTLNIPKTNVAGAA